MKRIFYFLSFLLLLTSCSGKKDNKTISIGYINWDDGIALTHLVEVILEQQGYRVILKNADPAPIYATMARGKVDLLMDAWLPATQADYILKSATTRLYDTEAKIICIVSKKGAQCIECHHKDI